MHLLKVELCAIGRTSVWQYEKLSLLDHVK